MGLSALSADYTESVSAACSPSTMPNLLRRSLLVLALAAVTAGCGGEDTPTAPSANVPFQRIDLRIGTGAEVSLGRSITVSYTGWLYSATGTDNKGTQFDSNASFSLVHGGGTVIAGWTQGFTGMRVGGQRRLVIPPDLGYGQAGRPPIPGNSTLIFDVELLSMQ